MKIRISTLLAVLLATPVAAMAQSASPQAPADTTTVGAPSGSAPVRHGHHGGMLHLLQGLGLSDAQHAQIQTIVADARTKNQGVTDPATRKANMRAMRSSIEAVLTPDQRTQLTQKMQQMRAQRRAERDAAPVPSAT